MATTAPPPTIVPRRREACAPAPQVDVVLPVYNEEGDLARSVLRLHAYLTGNLPFTFRVTIADNASVDQTWPIAQWLAETLPGVRAVHLDQKGRGRALRAVWQGSDAGVLAYMDVDLSTDLAALLPLVAPLLSGHSDLAIGTRLARSSLVVRGARREVISRCYNLLLHAALGARFSDAQCGFKAIRADRARELLPLVEDTGWFFDTELLVLAERSGLRIHEVPVETGSTTPIRGSRSPRRRWPTSGASPVSPGRSPAARCICRPRRTGAGGVPRRRPPRPPRLRDCPASCCASA